MATVKVSPKYQVVIPRDVRERLGIRVGEDVQIFLYDGRIEFVPVRKAREMRGMLKGMDTAVARDEDRL
ncbi:MAG: AbrB/MazE/SpoVT family DNA-binding domain-containing protein [Thermoanaerobaculaceae bacterium]